MTYRIYLIVVITSFALAVFAKDKVKPNLVDVTAQDNSTEVGEKAAGKKMESGYVCTVPNPNWCQALEKKWLLQQYAKTRDEYTKFVFDLFDSGNYDNRTRPGFSTGAPDQVKVRLYLESLGPVSVAEMSFFQDLYLTQIWTDHRLDGVKLANMTPNVTIPMYPDIVYSLWTPDTYFRNGISTEIVETHAKKIGLIVKIDTSGKIMVTKRLRVKANCPMYLQYFPFDRQLCELEIGSFSFDNEDITFKWASEPLHFKPGLLVAQFDFLDHILAVRQFHIPTMPSHQTILVVQYLLHRQIALYIGQVYLPSMLIVVVSWVTFYINPGAVPARASIGITCVLTMMTLTTSSIGNFPTNLQYTPVDIYLGACFLFVLGALFEFAAVNFSETTIKRREGQQQTPKATRGLTPKVGNSPKKEMNGATKPALLQVHDENDNLHCGHIRKNGNPKDYEDEVGVMIEDGADNSDEETLVCGMAFNDPGKIDYYSRYVYPLLFILFNIVYWTYSLTESSRFNRMISKNLDLAAVTN